jgi:hypothetical protein
MKRLFKIDFGVEPILVVDSAFFEDQAMGSFADAGFIWFTLAENSSPLVGGRLRLYKNISISEFGSLSVSLAMTQWDSRARDKGISQNHGGGRVVDDGTILKSFLADATRYDLSVIATWNDIGEGTGVNRAVGYKFRGKELPAETFLDQIRSSRCE